MDNTKLIAELRERASSGSADTFVLHKALVALEAAEAQLTRRDAVLSDLAAEFDANGNINDDPGEVAVWHKAADRVRSCLAAAPVSLEAKEGETTTEWGVRWTGVEPTVVTDRGAAEADVRRLVEANSEICEAVSREVTEWLSVDTEGDNRG